MPPSQFILRGTRPPAETQPHKDSPDGFHLIYDASRYSLYSGTKAQMDAQCDDFCQVHRRHCRRGPGLAQAHHTQKAVPPFAVSPSAAEVSCCGYVTNRHTQSGLRRRPPGTADGWRAWLASQRVVRGRGPGADRNAGPSRAPTSGAPTSRAPASGAIRR